MPTTEPLSAAAFTAAELRAEVARQNITQQQLGDRMGVRQWWVSRRLTGDVPITVEDLVRFAAALGVPMSQFLPEDVSA